MDLIQVLFMCGKLDVLYVHNFIVFSVSNCTSPRRVRIRSFVSSLRKVFQMMQRAFVIVASRCSVGNWSTLCLELSFCKYSGIVLGGCSFCREVQMINDCTMS